MRAHVASPGRAATGLLVLLLLPLLLLAAGVRPARAVEVQVESPSIAFDRDANRYTYEDARLSLGELEIFASRLVLDVDAGRLHGSGLVRLRNGPVYGDAAEVELDVATRTGTLTDASLYDADSGYRLRAERLELRGDGTLRAGRCTLTTCPADVTGWRIAASSLELRPGEVALAYNTTLDVGPVPVLWLPAFAWPTVSERRSGVLVPRLSRQTSSLARLDLGYRLEVPLFLNLGLAHDLTLTPEVVQNRGGALGAEYNYAFVPGQRGRLRLWGIAEREPRDPAAGNVPAGVDPAARDSTPARYLLDWGHNRAFGDAGRLVLRYEHASDGQVRREYEGVTEYRPYRSYQAGLTALTGLGDLAGTFERNAEYTAESVYADSEAFTDLDLRPQLLPRLSYRAGARPWAALPLGFELTATAARFVADEAVSGRLYTAGPALSLPLALGGAFELRTRLARRFVGYRDLEQGVAGGPDQALADEDLAQSEGRIELRTTLARDFRPRTGAWEALRHRVTPRLVARGREDVPQPFTGHVLRARPALRLLTLRLDNTLLGRARGADAGGPAAEVLRFDLIQRYNLLLRDDAPQIEGPPLPSPGETGPGEPLLPLLLDAAVNGPGYTLGLALSYHHQRDRITESTITLDGRLSPRTRLGVRYRFNEFTYFTPDDDLVPATNAFGFDGEAALTGRLSAGFDGRINLQDAPPPLDRRLDRLLLFVDFHPVCYRVRVSYEEQVGSTVEDGTTRFFVDRRVMLTFDITTLAGGGGDRGALALGGGGQP